MARPRKEIKKEEFEKLCALQCTLAEIAGFFDCSEDTIERWCKRTYKDDISKKPLGFAETYKIHSQAGKISIRRNQFRLAEKSAAMAIFLGKNYLGQTDAYINENSNDGVLAQLIDGLKQPKEGKDDIYRKTAWSDALMAGGQAETPEPS